MATNNNVSDPRLYSAGTQQSDELTQMAQADVMVPAPIQDALDGHARGTVSAGEAKKVLKLFGWQGDLRRGRYDYKIFDPTGKVHYHQP